MSTKRKILLFGGSFNPIHFGHLRMAQEAVERLSFNEVIFIPSGSHPLKKDPQSFMHRAKMTKLAIEDIDYFKMSEIEGEKGDYSYTIDTIQHFKGKLPDDDIFWLIGTDTIRELKDWHEPEKLLTECKFVLADRNPYRNYIEDGEGDLLTFLSKELKDLVKYPVSTYFIPLINDVLEISSTRIRERIKCEEKYALRFLVPQKVEQYIYDNNLYRNKS